MRTPCCFFRFSWTKDFDDFLRVIWWVLRQNRSQVARCLFLGQNRADAESSGEFFFDVVKSVGKLRPPGDAKYRAATESELMESSGEFPDVAKSLGEVRPRVVAKCSGMGDARPSEFAKCFASFSDPEFLELVEKVFCLA